MGTSVCVCVCDYMYGHYAFWGCSMAWLISGCTFPDITDAKMTRLLERHAAVARAGVDDVGRTDGGGVCGSVLCTLEINPSPDVNREDESTHGSTDDVISASGTCSTDGSITQSEEELASSSFFGWTRQPLEMKWSVGLWWPWSDGCLPSTRLTCTSILVHTRPPHLWLQCSFKCKQCPQGVRSGQMIQLNFSGQNLSI